MSRPAPPRTRSRTPSRAQVVAAPAAVEDVAARPALEPVASVLALELVIPRASADDVAPALPVDVVVSSERTDDVVRRSPVEDVIAGRAADRAAGRRRSGRGRRRGRGCWLYVVARRRADKVEDRDRVLGEIETEKALVSRHGITLAGPAREDRAGIGRRAETGLRSCQTAKRRASLASYRTLPTSLSPPPARPFGVPESEKTGDTLRPLVMIGSNSQRSRERLLAGLLTVLAIVVASLATAHSAPAALADHDEAQASPASGCASPCPAAVFGLGNIGGTVEAVTEYADRPNQTATCSLVPGGFWSFSIDEFASGAFLRPVSAGFRGWPVCPGTQAGDTCRVTVGSAESACITFTARSTDPVPSSPCPPPFVQVYKKGDGRGTVTASGATPSGPVVTETCGPTCPSGVWTRFAPNAAVTLTATASDGHFERWELCPDPQGTVCRLTLSQVALVCAVFVKTTPPADTDCPARVGTNPQPGASAAGPPPLGSRCTIVGSPGGEVIHGTATSDVICGRGGADRIYAGGGHDLILGGRGNDRIYGRSGRDHIRGDGGNDILNGAGGADRIVGGRGADTMYARDGARDIVNGGTGRDRARLDRMDRRTSVERRF